MENSFTAVQKQVVASAVAFELRKWGIIDQEEYAIIARSADFGTAVIGVTRSFIVPKDLVGTPVDPDKRTFMLPPSIEVSPP